MKVSLCTKPTTHKDMALSVYDPEAVIYQFFGDGNFLPVLRKDCLLLIGVPEGGRSYTPSMQLSEAHLPNLPVIFAEGEHWGAAEANIEMLHAHRILIIWFPNPVFRKTPVYKDRAACA